MDKNFEVVVVGNGIAGLATAWHLMKAGVTRIGLASNAGLTSASASAAGFAAGGQNDNLTRVSNAHGLDFAKDLWSFGDESFDALMAYCDHEKVWHARQRRLRLITSEHELTEAEAALSQAGRAGLAVELIRDVASSPWGEGLLGRVVAIQDDGPRGAWVDVPGLLGSLLARTTAATQLPVVSAIEARTGEKLQLKFADGTTARCEMVAVCAHLGTGALVPEIASALVSVADQWSLVDWGAPPSRPWAEPGIVFSLNHTYEWGVTRADGRLSLGGGRYLRPMAGIEATKAPAEPRITAHLMQQLSKTFVSGNGAQAASTLAALDCRPCDELPIIGPMFGEGRILLATGFMGSGLTMGFFAGRCLAELITKGAAPRLPRRLWPERLRSLEA